MRCGRVVYALGTLVYLYLFLLILRETSSFSGLCLVNRSTLVKRGPRSAALKTSAAKFHKHGATHLALPFNSTVTLKAYFALCCDVSPNPGPTTCVPNQTDSRTCINGEKINAGKLSAHGTNCNCYSNNINTYASKLQTFYNESHWVTPWQFDQVDKQIPVRISTRNEKRFSSHYRYSRSFRHCVSIPCTTNLQVKSSVPEVCQKNNNITMAGIPVRISSRHNRKVINRRNPTNLVYVNTDNDQLCKLGSNMRFALWNALSINKKAAIICDIIQSNKLDILAVTKTWSNKNTKFSSAAEVLNTIRDFAVLEAPRLTGRGGGLAVFFRKSLKITKYTDITFQSFEHLDLSVTFGNFNTRMVLVYRPPPSKKNNLTPTTFFTDFSDLIEDLTVSDKPFFIAGDFNLHIDNKSNPDTVKFLNLLDSTNMIQMVSGPTHR